MSRAADLQAEDAVLGHARFVDGVRPSDLR
jgi:hypothetical protein